MFTPAGIPPTHASKGGSAITATHETATARPYRPATVFRRFSAAQCSKTAPMKIRTVITM